MYHSAIEPRPVSCSSFVPLLRRMSFLILKRGFDLVFSLVLLVTCALLMAVIALVVWLDSPGEIIYTQIRLGYGGKPFTIYKFRSMQQSTAPDDAKWTSENDTRITRVGHILRLTHLDELHTAAEVLDFAVKVVINSGAFGARANKAHFAHKDVEQLLIFCTFTAQDELSHPQTRV